MHEHERTHRGVAAWIAGLLAVVATATLPAQDGTAVDGWLHWRGPAQNGTSTDTGLPDTWKVNGANHRWTVDLCGRGAPVIADGRVYTWGYRGEEDELREVLACLDEKTGKAIWEHEFPDFLSDVIYDRYSIGSPTIDGETGNVYLLTSPGLLVCFTRDGKKVWERSLLEELGRNTYPNGRTGAPVIEGDLVIMHSVTNNWGREGPPRDRFYAFEKRTGELVWSSTPGKGPPFLKDSCFSTPVRAYWPPAVEGSSASRWARRVLYCGLGSGAIVCVDARTGEPIWRSQQIIGGINSSIVLHGDNLIAIHGRQNLDSTETGRLLALKLPSPDRVTPGKLLELGPKDEVWRAPLCMFTSSPVLVGDRLYQVVQTGDLWCVDVTTGKQLWHKKLGPSQIHASPLWADGKLYVPMNNGTFWILRPSDEGAEELAKVKLAGNCLGAPSTWNGNVYVHTTKRLYCFGSDDFKRVTAVPYAGPGNGIPPSPKPTQLQIVPCEVLLRPGEKATFTIWALDASGKRMHRVTEGVEWAPFVPPTAKVKAKMDAAFNDAGELVAGADAKLSAGAFKATAGGLSGTIRGRVIPNLPYTEDLESFELTQTHAQEGVKFAYPPLPWITARMRWEVRERDGSKVLAKTTDNLILHRAYTFVGHPDESNYTISADVMSDGNRRGLGEVGVINQRYVIKLKGNHDRIEVSSNLERFRVWADFVIKPKVWYRLKTRVDVAADGSGVIRAKAWKRGEPEPAAWTIEAKHARAHTHGVPGIVGISAQPAYRVYVDNIEIVPSEKAE